MKKTLLALTLLAGCAAGIAQPVPQAARLSDTTLTLVLSNGQACRADWVAAPQGGFGDCAPGFGYAVERIDNPNILRQIWAGLTTALGAEGVVPPMARVVITAPSGQETVFASPPPVPED